MKFGNAEAQYTLYMIDYYGRDFVDEMIATKKNTLKMYAGDYREYISETKALINHHLERINAK